MISPAGPSLNIETFLTELRTSPGYADQMVYSGSNLTSARLRTYATAAAAASPDLNTPLATYTITCTYVSGKLDTYTMVRV